jgi:hypothetical protein
MADLRRDFWIRETGTGQQVAQIHDRYMTMMILMMMIQPGWVLASSGSTIIEVKRGEKKQ